MQDIYEFLMSDELENETKFKEKILDYLQYQGFFTLSKFLELSTLEITQDPDVTASIDEEQHIQLNAKLAKAGNLDLVSFLLRHEAMHYYAEHFLRMFKFASQKLGVPEDKLKDMTLEEMQSVDGIREFLLKNYKGGRYPIYNVAADLEQSEWYLDSDLKYVLDGFMFDGHMVRGLYIETFEEDLPKDATFEEIYNILLEKDREYRMDKYEILNAIQDDDGNYTVTVYFVLYDDELLAYSSIESDVEVIKQEIINKDNDIEYSDLIAIKVDVPIDALEGFDNGEFPETIQELKKIYKNVQVI